MRSPGEDELRRGAQTRTQAALVRALEAELACYPSSDPRARVIREQLDEERQRLLDRESASGDLRRASR